MTEMEQFHQVVAQLAKLREKNESKERYLEELRKNVKSSIDQLSPCEELKNRINETDKVSTAFVSISLHVLKKLAAISEDDSLTNLISIQQQQKIKLLLQMIFSIGLFPTHLRGVNILLGNKTAELNLSHLEDLSQVELYNMMTDILRSLFEILKSSSLRPLVLAHLRDIMASLLQIVHAGEFKKPASNPGAEAKAGDFVMTEEWYRKLVEDRSEFRVAYEKLVGDIYKPLVIRELLILLSPAPSLQLKQEVMPPQWLRRTASQQLSAYLTGPDGVALVMRAMCDSSSDHVEWAKVESVAKLISTVQGNLSPNEFYSLIGPQVVSLLSASGAYCVPVAKKCIKNIYNHDPRMCAKYVLDNLFEPFIACSRPLPLDSGHQVAVVVAEEDLSRSVDRIAKCFAPGSKESAISFEALLKIVKILYRLYMKVAESPFELRQSVRDVLIRFLYSRENLDELASVYDALIFDVPLGNALEMNDELEFAFAPSGGVQVVKKCESTPSGEGFALESEITADHMFALLSHNEDYSKKLLYDLYVVLLSSMSEWYYEDIGIPDSSQELLSADELIVYVMRKSQKKIISIKLLSMLAENVNVMEIPKDPQMILDVVGSLLDKNAEAVLRGRRNRDEDDDGDGDGEEVSLALLIGTLTILDVATKNIKIGEETWNRFAPLLKSVAIIKDNCQDALVRILSESLYARIVTHGAVSEAEGKRKSADSGNSPAAEVELEAAVKESCSEEVSTRGHGLIALGKLLRSRNRETLSSKDRVFAIFKTNLGHDDTYIYLSAINGLEALALVDAEAVLELLSNEYAEKEDFEMRMKVGEALVRITRALGESVRRHKSLLVNTFLRGAKHADEYVRASSLSNLGEVLTVLGFGVGPILQEVYVCVESIAATDKSDVARRAAVLVAQLLLKGVSETSFAVLETVIRDLYRTLLRIRKTDADEVTRLHADLAVAEIDRLVRSSFDPPSKLEKRIGILSLQR